MYCTYDFVPTGQELGHWYRQYTSLRDSVCTFWMRTKLMSLYKYNIYNGFLINVYIIYTIYIILYIYNIIIVI